MHDVIVGGLLIALGVVLEANMWFAGAATVGLVLIIIGAVVAAVGLVRVL